MLASLRSGPQHLEEKPGPSRPSGKPIGSGPSKAQEYCSTRQEPWHGMLPIEAFIHSDCNSFYVYLVHFISSFQIVPDGQGARSWCTAKQGFLALPPSAWLI